MNDLNDRYATYAKDIDEVRLTINRTAIEDRQYCNYEVYDNDNDDTKFLYLT